MEHLLKLMGATLTVLTALVYSAVKNRETRERIVKCKLLCDFLCECKMQVECHALPLEGILTRCSSYLPQEFIECARRDGLAVAVKKCASILFCGEKERLLLAEFAEGFGKSPAGAEAERCEECIKKLERHTVALENGAKTECKTRLAVSLCVSLMTVLLFA